MSATLRDTVTFDLDASEGRRIVEEWSGIRGKTLWWISALNVANLVYVGSNFLRHARNPESGLMAVATAVAFALLILVAITVFVVGMLRSRPRYPRGRLSLTFTEGGVEIVQADGVRRAIGWSSIARAYDCNEGIVLACRANARFSARIDAILVPKRAIPGGGVALWSFLEARLVGSRYLRPTPGKRALLVNTAT